MKKTKKIIAGIVCALLVVSLLSVNSLAMTKSDEMSDDTKFAVMV